MPLPPKIIEQRMSGLMKNMETGASLITDLEADIAVGTTMDKARSQRSLDQVNELLERWGVEYSKFEVDVNATKAVNPVAGAQLGEQLAVMQKQIELSNERAAAIQAQLTGAESRIIGQVQTSETNIRKDLAEARKALLDRYDESQREVLSKIFERMDKDQLDTLAAINDKLDDKALKGSVVEADYREVTEALTVIEQAPEVPAEIKQEIVKVKQAAEAEKSDNGVKSGLKLALPIIPGLLDISADTGNLKDASFNVNLGIIKGELKVSDAVNAAAKTLNLVWNKFKSMSKPAATA